MSSRHNVSSLILLTCVIPTFVMCMGCNPWVFTLQENTGWPIEGRILRNYDSVDVVAPNAIRISHNSRVAMRCVNLTDGVFTADVDLRYGSILTLEFRTTPYDDSVKNADGLILHIGRDEVRTVYQGQSSTVPTNTSTSNPFNITVTQHGRWIDVEVACTDVGRFYSTQPSTQWVMAHTSAPGSALLVDPRFSPLSFIF
jgi:hypothetical protein